MSGDNSCWDLLLSQNLERCNVANVDHLLELLPKLLIHNGLTNSCVPEYSVKVHCINIIAFMAAI